MKVQSLAVFSGNRLRKEDCAKVKIEGESIYNSLPAICLQWETIATNLQELRENIVSLIFLFSVHGYISPQIPKSIFNLLAPMNFQ